MNIRKNWKRLKKRGRALREKRNREKSFRRSSPIFLYVAFVVLASTFCILLAQLSHGSQLRVWYYKLTHNEIIHKGIQHSAHEGKDDKQMGDFLTYYRFQSFGSSNPAEIDVNAPMIALTFDDGPNPDNTERILNVLKENYSKATFFVVGTNAEKYPDMLKAISSSGSEIGNHTFNHSNLTELSSADVEEQINKVDRAVKKATGENTTVIRPPYGAYDDNLLNRLEAPVVLWDLDTEDWNSRNAQAVVDNVLSKVKDGDIILMHDIYESTAEAVEILVPKLKEQGFLIVTVSEMAKYKGKELEKHKAYGVIGGTAQ